MNLFFNKKLISSVLFGPSIEKRSIFKIVSSHTLMILSVCIKTANLNILKTIGLEPWILITCWCFGGLTFISILSILSFIRDPIPDDQGTIMASLSYSIGQLFVLIIYHINGSLDDQINYCSMVLLPILILFGSIHEFNYMKLSNNMKNGFRLSLLSVLVAVFSTLFAFPKILKFEYLRNNIHNFLTWFLTILIYVFCKIFYYFGIINVDRKKIKLLEISAVNILNISKIGIPIGILVHAYRMKMLLPDRKYISFLFDFARCDRQTAFYIFLSSIISFGITLPLDVISFGQISLIEYTIYSIAPNVIISKSYVGIGLLLLALVMQFCKDIYINRNFKSNFEFQMATQVNGR